MSPRNSNVSLAVCVSEIRALGATLAAVTTMFEPVLSVAPWLSVTVNVAG